MSRRRLAGGVAGVLALLVTVVLTLPFLLEERTFIASTPTSAPVGGTIAIPLDPGQELCLGNLGISPRSQVVQLAVESRRGPVPPVALELEAPGYRGTGRLPQGSPAGPPVRVPISPAPQEESGEGRLCLTNAGDRRVAFLGSPDPRGTAPLPLTRDGEELPAGTQPWITFLERERRGILGHAGEVLRRIDVLRPLPEPLVALLGLAVIMLPFGVAAALLSAERREPS